MGKCVALGSNDVAFVAWSYEQPIPGCLGFAIYRQSETQPAPTALPAWVGFEGEANPNWQPKTTEQWPVQKFSWRDLTATAGASYVYTVVPMVGVPGALKPQEDLKLTSAKVVLTPQRSPHVRAFFTRGILSTQHLVHSLPQGPGGGPSSVDLLAHIRTPGDPLRASLAGQSIEALSALPTRAIHDGGVCHGALYELDDPELLALLDTPAHVALVLSNSGADDGVNKPARQRLHQDGVPVTDRMLANGHIGHDKFMVYIDSGESPQAVLTGSTNWTSNALCAQSNNQLIIEDEALAKTYLEFWTRLQAESPAGEPAKQSKPFRAENDNAHNFDVDGASITLWFSPNTQDEEKKPDSPMPSDMADAFELIEAAQHGVLFLLFQPGSPSVLDAIAKAGEANPQLFIRGAATDPKAIEQFETQLHQRPGEPVAQVAAASAVKDQFGYWQRELLKPDGAHAIIHDKIVVIDPLSPDCVVITGSHNLGYRASYNNDENLLIIKGHRALAEAYAVHVMDVYDHYRWRWLLEKQKQAAFTGLKPSDGWQTKYFDQLQHEVAFWLPA